MQIFRALNEAQAAGLARLDGQLLLAHLLQRPREWLLAHDDETLRVDQHTAFTAGVAKRLSGVPLAYIVGEREFHGLLLKLTPDVLVPRPETELLVDWALALLAEAPAVKPSVIDLGTGSGAVALAVAAALPADRAAVTATDASPAALAVARNNALRLQLKVQFVEGDWWAPLAGRQFHMALSNPPYIAGDDQHLHALRHEPRAALTPEGNGLDALRRIITGAPAHLLPGAWLLLEHGHDQAATVCRLLTEQGFLAPTTRQDLAGLPRCSGAVWPGRR
jgi:release factor glutamine methyltransferase